MKMGRHVTIKGTADTPCWSSFRCIVLFDLVTQRSMNPGENPNHFRLTVQLRILSRMVTGMDCSLWTMDATELVGFDFTSWSSLAGRNCFGYGYRSKLWRRKIGPWNQQCLLLSSIEWRPRLATSVGFNTLRTWL